MEKKSRNLGIDLLRLISMYGIVLLHVLGDSAINAPWMSKSYLVAWILETAALCTVNIYGLISGYVGVAAGSDPKRLLRLWLQVVFTSLTITAGYTLWQTGTLTLSALRSACTPISSTTYWYATAYVGVLLLQPFLNQAILHTTDKEQRFFFLCVLLFFGVIPLATRTQPFWLINGYSMAWLVILYLLGGILRQQNLPERLGRPRAALLYVGGTALALGGKLLVEHLGLWRDGTVGNGAQYVTFPSPALLLAAVGALCFFVRTPVKGLPAKAVKCFAPAAFGVYLWHIHPLTWNYIFSPALPKLASYGHLRLPALALSCAAVIFLLCLCIEKLRLLLFRGLRWGFARLKGAFCR